MLNVGRLRVLKEVAYRGSFSGAAEALSYSQSAVSQQIAALEAQAGMTLLERHARGVSLTAAGQTLVGHAEGILARLEAAESALSAIAGLHGGRLRMASFPTAGATLMPLAIATFRSSYPDVELTLAEGEPEEIVPRLIAGELDLALLFEFAGESPRQEGMTVVELLEDPMYLALPGDHALAAREKLRLQDLGGKPGCRPPGRARAPATSSAAATPPGSSQTCRSRAMTIRRSRVWWQPASGSP